MTWKLKAAFAASALIVTAASAAAGCPQIRVIKNTGHWVITNAGGSQVEAEISNPQIECVIKNGVATAKVKFTMSANMSGGEAPVYVAVADMTEGTPLFTSKEIVNKQLQTGETEVVFENVTIPLGARRLTSDYQVLVGFQLSNEQLAAERKRNSWFSWLY